MKLWMVLLIILAILVVALVVLYFLGKRAEKKQAEQKEQLDAVAQTLNMLIIDKKKLRIKDAGFPAMVLENTPKYLRWSKVPVVKAKVGPRIMTLMCDIQIYDLIPIKKEVKAVVSGIYITSVKGVRGPLETPKKKKLFERIKDRIKGEDANAKNEKQGKGSKENKAEKNNDGNSSKPEAKVVKSTAANNESKNAKPVSANTVTGKNADAKESGDGKGKGGKSANSGKSTGSKGSKGQQRKKAKKKK